jgi:hypothetical protein
VNIVQFNQDIEGITEIMPTKISFPPNFVINDYTLSMKYGEPFISIRFMNPIATDEGSGVYSIKGQCIFYVSDARKAIKDENNALLDYKITIKFKFTVYQTTGGSKKIEAIAESRLIIPSERSEYFYCKNCESEYAMFKNDGFTFNEQYYSNIALTSVTIERQTVNGEESEKYKIYTMKN